MQTNTAFIIPAGDAPDPALDRLAAAVGGIVLDHAPEGENSPAVEVWTEAAILHDPPPIVRRSASVRAAFLDGSPRWPASWSRGTIGRLAEMDLVFIADPRAMGAVELLTDGPVSWLGFPASTETLASALKPCHGKAEGSPVVLVLPSVELHAPEATAIGRRICEALTSVRILTAGCGESVVELASESVCAIDLDDRSRFGFEVVSVVAAGTPIVGSRTLTAQALLSPETAVDSLLEMRRARDLVASLVHGPARRAAAVECARTRLVELMSPHAVAARFRKGLQSIGLEIFQQEGA